MGSRFPKPSLLENCVHSAYQLYTNFVSCKIKNNKNSFQGKSFRSVFYQTESISPHKESKK